MDFFAFQLPQLFFPSFYRPGAVGKGPGSAAHAWRQPQDAEEAGRAREEAFPDRRGNQNFLKAKSLHQVGLLSWWGQVCCAALPEHPLLLGRNGHHFLGGKEKEPRSRPWAHAGANNSVQYAAGISCSPFSAVSCPQKKERDTLIKALLSGLGSSCLCCLTSHRSALCSGAVASPLTFLFFLLLETGRRSLVLLPVVFLVILFLLSWTMVMAHPEHLRAQGTAWEQERGTELQCFLPREGLSCQEGLVGCLEKPLLSVGQKIIQ